MTEIVPFAWVAFSAGCNHYTANAHDAKSWSDAGILTVPLCRHDEAKAEIYRMMRLMMQARAAMRSCGWHIALASEPSGYGILEAACVEIEAIFGEALAYHQCQSSPVVSQSDANLQGNMREEIERLRQALNSIIDLDHHNMGPESKATKLARTALKDCADD